MRLSVSKRGMYHADTYCRNTLTAKKCLKEKFVSILAVDFYLDGRENGSDLISWGLINGRLPQFVVITESDRSKRFLLGRALQIGGYRSGDGTTYFKH